MSNKENLTAMDCWHYIAPIIPITDEEYTKELYVMTFRAFKLLEKEEKEKNEQTRHNNPRV